MDKTEILAEAMRLADEYYEADTCQVWDNTQQRDALESFLREHLVGQAEPVTMSQPSATPAERTPRDEWPTDAATAVGHLAGMVFMYEPSDEIGHCVRLITDALESAAPVASEEREAFLKHFVPKKEAIHMINALIAGESLPKDSLVLLDDLCHYASREHPQPSAATAEQS